ncbi:MAG TPA: cytidylate kinase-like family protein [Candidatus Scybalocola faecigallinarum]|uniref:Cytidylate kinase-like family protein n=1 Tax=Candidatus Scybalocola faecigallinarum TaxID=2840941 RepID=A0A9D1F4I5_9FIRM|nr:cytidylate kinase-like family protein [Candidatus Scybalocola faecigallinarum]
MQENKEKCMELAKRIYNLDEEVYSCVGSSLGRSFTGNKESTIQNLCSLMLAKPGGHLLRSELALISNMARTIKDKTKRAQMMAEYDSILKEIESLPDTFGKVDIMDLSRAELNPTARKKLSENDHLVICISRTQGSAGNDIGFELADDLHINYYDVEIFNQVLTRLEAEKGSVNDTETEHFEDFDKYRKRNFNLKKWFREFNRYHGLPRQDAVFFNMSDLICSLAKTEDCVIMGRCADAILTNNHIPHLSLFISAPFSLRVQRIMASKNMDLRHASRFLKQMDRQHKKYYDFYSYGRWGHPENYDLCINSANYGIRETIDLIERLINRQKIQNH